jgi:hypothetical protein
LWAGALLTLRGKFVVGLFLGFKLAISEKLSKNNLQTHTNNYKRGGHRKPLKKNKEKLRQMKRKAWQHTNIKTSAIFCFQNNLILLLQMSTRLHFNLRELWLNEH